MIQDIDYTEIKAVSNIVVDLESNPLLLAKFVIDLDNGTHKRWAIYKKEVGKLKEAHFRGRTVPVRASKGGGGMATIFGKVNGKENTNLFNSQINLLGLTPVQKVKAILNSGASEQVQKDLLGEVLR